MVEEVLHEEQGEKLQKGPKIIGVIGPHRIGKDTIISSLKEKLSGDIRIFSIGQYIEDRLFKVDDSVEAEKDFASELDGVRVKSEDARLNRLTGVIEYNRA